MVGSALLISYQAFVISLSIYLWGSCVLRTCDIFTSSSVLEIQAATQDFFEGESSGSFLVCSHLFSR